MTHFDNPSGRGRRQNVGEQGWSHFCVEEEVK